MSRLTLTFDNGPDPQTTDEVLRVLGERGLRATFFVVGEQLRQPGSRAVAERARAEGHWIGNHSMTHSVALGDSGDRLHVEREIGAAQELLGDLAHPYRLFRPFGGGGHLGPHLLSAPAVDYLLDNRYTVVLWNSVPRDWEDPIGWARTAWREVASRDWTVLVLHDLPTGAMEHLPGFLDEVIDAGVEIVQEVPEACVPIRGGAAQWPLDHLVSAAVASPGR